MTMTQKRKIVSIRFVKKYFRVSIPTLKKWEKEGRLVAFARNARGDRVYRWSDVEKFIENCPKG
jgi:DNA-binding transcriptional MerR regulator